MICCSFVFLICLLSGKELASSMSCVFSECSAKQNENVETVFKMLIDEMERLSAPPKSAPAAQSSGCSML